MNLPVDTDELQLFRDTFPLPLALAALRGYPQEFRGVHYRQGGV